MNRPSQSGPIAAVMPAVLKPILYADIFDFPLTFEEVYQFLDVKTAPEVVRQQLDQAVEAGQITCLDGYYSLAGRTNLAAKRRERLTASRKLWPKAIHYGRWLAALPFIRMVAVTGSLAVDNPRDGVDDIDYLIVTQPGRLWLCRAWIIMMVRFGHLKGTHLCPNYLITENKLYFDTNDFFTAREMVQMKLIYGVDFYQKMWEVNAWVKHFFPHGQATGIDRQNDSLSAIQQAIKAGGEWVFGGFLGDVLERWLQKYQITKHTQLAGQNGAYDTLLFTPDICKGHYDGHKHKTMLAYQQRVEKFEKW
ncbi:MAG: hypothetical protein KDJ97_17505 [Anaerolineae bacterium]|nr:hypothetical protein [Anaerolineae bacterium]